MTSTELEQWYEGPRVGGFDYATDPQDAYRKYIAETPVLRDLGRVVVFGMDDILFINRDHALCVAAGPDVYDLDEGGYCVLPSEIVPPTLAAQATAGAEACPERALRVDED